MPRDESLKSQGPLGTVWRSCCTEVRLLFYVGKELVKSKLSSGNSFSNVAEMPSGMQGPKY